MDKDIKAVSTADLMIEKSKLEEKIDKLEKRGVWIERELDCIRGSLNTLKADKYSRLLGEKDDLKMERMDVDHELRICRERLREIDALLAPAQ